MKKLLLGIALCAIGTVAGAADLPYKAPIAPAPIVTTDPFSGFYIGVNAGYGFNLTGVPTGASSGNTFVDLGTLATSPQGVVGGIHAGYGLHFGNFFYVGAESDIEVGNVSGTATMPGLITANSQDNWFGSLRARVGITPFSHLLVYGTGGLAYGDLKDTFTFNSLTGCGTTCTFSSSTTQTGVAWGFGIETALNSNWLIRAEWLRYDLGKFDTSTGAALAPTVVTFSPEGRVDLVRAGLSYKF